MNSASTKSQNRCIMCEGQLEKANHSNICNSCKDTLHFSRKHHSKQVVQVDETKEPDRKSEDIEWLEPVAKGNQMSKNNKVNAVHMPVKINNSIASRLK